MCRIGTLDQLDLIEQWKDGAMEKAVDSCDGVTVGLTMTTSFPMPVRLPPLRVTTHSIRVNTDLTIPDERHRCR